MSNSSTSRLFAHKPFLRFWLARLSGVTANQMLMVAVAWHMYDITSSAWDLGLVGLFQFLPALLMTLPAGHLADRLHRGRIVATCMLAQAAMALLLVVATQRGFATRELILCAGSIGSPQILQLSGIGPGALLQQHGIPIEQDLPGVGANLQDHLQIRAVFKVQGVKTLNTMANSLWGKAKIGLEYALKRSGPMSMAPSQLGAFTRSDPTQPYPNIEYHVQPLSLDAFGEPLHDFPAITASVCNLNPSSRGSVQIKSARFEDAPAIAPNYLSTTQDRLVAADSLRLTRTIMAQPALARFQPQEYKPGVQFQSDEELARLAGDIATTIFHPVGTTKMGRADDPTAVVDSHLRVRGVAGLRVVDAGVMPLITSGNTNSPVLMLAEKAARWIAQDS